MSKHILVISQYFYPEQFRINDICKEWVKKGYKVTVITGIPNYPQGKFYKGYGFFKNKTENYAGVNIKRISLFPRGNNSLTLALNYFSFVLSGFFWKLFSGIKADYVFIFEVSPMTQALPGVWYAKKHRIPCFIYVQDLWPENVEVVTGVKNKYIIGAIDKMVDYIYRNSDKIFTTSKGFVRAIVNRGVAESKVEYWPQYAESFYKPVENAYKPNIPTEGIFNIVFTGNIGQAQGLDMLPKVALDLRDKGYEDIIRFNIIGDGRYKDTLVNNIKQYNITNMFNFIKKQPPEEIPVFIGCCDAAFLSFASEKLYNMTIPAKLQSYLACGIPILASAGGESEEIINDSQAGFCTENGNAKRLTSSIIKLMKMSKQDRKQMGKNARSYYERYFDKDYLLSKMDETFKKEGIKHVQK